MISQSLKVRDIVAGMSAYTNSGFGKQFGFDGDIVPNLGDLDCDGITDLTVVRNDGRPELPGFKVWYTALSASATIHETVFGSVRDRAAIADLNGDGCSEMVALREGFHWYGLKLGANTLSVVQWGLPGDIPLLPADLNGDGAPDYIVVRVGLGMQFAYVRYGDNDFEVIPLGPETSVPMVGAFGRSSPFAFALRDSGKMQFADLNASFLFGGPNSAVIRPDGTSVHSGDEGRFFKADDDGVVSAIRPFDDQIGTGCKAPKIPDGRRKKRAWLSPNPLSNPLYYLNQRARKLQLFSSSGKFLDSFSLLDPGGRSSRELWGGNRSAAELESYAPLLLKETLVDGTCNWIDIEHPTSAWD